MKKKFNFSMLIMVTLVIHAMISLGQTYTQPTSVVSLGGKSVTTGNYSHFCVVGEPVVMFNISSGTYTGSIGFLPNAGGNNRPVAIIQPDPINTYSDSLVSIDGSSSYDPDGDDLSYVWIMPDGVLVSDPTTSMINIIAPQVNYHRDFTVKLVVSDGLLTDTATAILSVHNADWMPITYPQSTIFVGLVTVDGHNADDGDIIGAFVNNECRGVDDIFTYNDKTYVSFLIQGDVANQQIIFKYADISNDELLFVPIDPLAKTNPGGYLGSFNSPYNLKAYHIFNHQLPISEGWSGISSPFTPVEPLVSSMFAPVANNLSILYNSRGMYWPAQNTNTLGSWVTQEGYIIKTSDTCILDFAGVDQKFTSLALIAGWQIIPVFSNCPANVVNLFTGLNLKIVKEVAGDKIYWPQFNINTLGNLQPYKSYYVSLQSSGTISFPACVKSSFITGNFEIHHPTDSYWGTPEPTPASHTIAIHKDALVGFSPQDQVGAFDQVGNLCGFLEIDDIDHDQALTLYGDDATSDFKDGFAENEYFSLRCYKPDKNEEYILSATFDPDLPEHDGLYVTNGLSAINGLKFSQTGIGEMNSGIQIFPNPARDKLHIVVNSINAQAVTIINMHGQLMYSSTISGYNTLINVSGFEPGVYFIRVISNDTRILRKFVKE